MDPADGESSSQKENSVASQRKILKASHSKHGSEKKEQQRHSEQTISNGRTVTIHFDQLDVIRVLGEGAFGEVVLVVDRNDPSIAAAVKRISLRGMDSETAKQVRKEALLQRAVNKHKNVLKYISMRTIGDEMIELYLEYAGGGELFDQIEPDVGMEPIRAQCYFRQVLNGLQYIHSNGIAHRDIKPENLLLDRNHVLKISDFGMATVFRHNGSERVLTTKCGTLPYAAPEVLKGHYRAEPIDIWSSGVVLVTMLVGELPWDAPTFDCEQYASFIRRDGDIDRRPWCRMDNMELSLLRLILCEDVNKRGTITRIKKHPWYVADLSNQNLEGRRKIYETGVPVRKASNAKKMKLDSVAASSQPAQLHSMKSVRDQESVVLVNVDKPRLPISCISQPVHYDLLSQPVGASQVGAYANSPATLVRRMTRFFVEVSVPEALKSIEKAAEFCDCEFKMVSSHQVFLIPKKNQDLCLVATVYEMHEDSTRKVLVDFRRSKGDGLEFKRMFVELKKSLSKIICPNSHGWLEKHGLVCTKRAAEIIQEHREDILPTIEEESGQRDMSPTFAVLIDLSGTLFIDEVAIPRASDGLKKLVSNPNFAVKFVTNTTKESVPNLLSRLHRTGFDFVRKESVFTSLTAARRLVEEGNLRPLLMLEPEAMEEFDGVDTKDPNAVVVGLAPSQFSYERMNEAFKLLHSNRDSQLIGIHKGRYYQRKDGLALGPGPFVSALEYATGKKAIVVGKPEAEFYHGALKTLGHEFLPENTVMIGDDVRDDIVGSLALGFRAVLVKTGKYRPGDEKTVEHNRDRFLIRDSVTEALNDILENDGKAFFG